MSAEESSRRGPLSGVRVLDAGTVLAAPIAATLLADFGADVVKVEEPRHGDPVRRFPPHKNGQALISKVTNRNKRSVGIDLHAERGRALFKRMVAWADVVVVNFRPATLKAWALDYDDLVAIKPDVIMLHLTGFGRTGPYTERPGFARIAEAYAGLTYITGYPDGPPLFPGYAIGDGLAGVYGAFSAMLALYHRRVTGRGQLVDLALYEPTLRILEELIVGYGVLGIVRERSGNVNPSVAPNDVYHTADGKWIALPASTPNMYSRLCEAVGRPDLVKDPRFVDNAARTRHCAELDAELRPAIERYPAAALLDTLEQAGVAAGPVNSVADLVADVHAWARGSLIKVRDPNLGQDVTMPGVFPRLSDSPGTVHRPGPEAGQDTKVTLAELLGLDAAALAALAMDGVISGD